MDETNQGSKQFLKLKSNLKVICVIVVPIFCSGKACKVFFPQHFWGPRAGYGKMSSEGDCEVGLMGYTVNVTPDYRSKWLILLPSSHLLSSHSSLFCIPMYLILNVTPSMKKWGQLYIPEYSNTTLAVFRSNMDLVWV